VVAVQEMGLEVMMVKSSQVAPPVNMMTEVQPIQVVFPVAVALRTLLMMAGAVRVSIPMAVQVILNPTSLHGEVRPISAVTMEEEDIRAAMADGEAVEKEGNTSTFILLDLVAIITEPAAVGVVTVAEVPVEVIVVLLLIQMVRVVPAAAVVLSCIQCQYQWPDSTSRRQLR
jgi:hypothetical protein